MSRSQSLMATVNPFAGSARRRRMTLVAAVVAGVFVFGGGFAAACIPWTGKYELQNLAQGDQDGDGTDEANEGDENGTAVYGADESDIDKNGNNIDDGTSSDNEGDRGNNQGMVWCNDTDDTGPNDNTADPFGQQYEWAEVHPASGDDIRLIVDDNNTGDDSGGASSSDEEDGCASDLYLPEDKYSITFKEDSFDNHDASGDSDGDGSCNDDPDECTYADDGGKDTNGDQGSSDSGDDDGSVEVTGSHCMDTDDDPNGDKTDKGANEIYWDLAEDETADGISNASEGDSTTSVDENRFTDPNDDTSGQHRDVVDEDVNGGSTANGDEYGLHDIKIDVDNFNYTASDSGDNDDTGGTEAAAICITSHEHFEHDNNDVDDGEKDNKQIEYGNAIPVNILASV